MAEELHRLRITTDVIYRGTKLSPSAARRVAQENSTHAHVLAFEDIKNIEVVYAPVEERVFYAHHHDATDGVYCTEQPHGCLEQAQDGYNQDL